MDRLRIAPAIFLALVVLGVSAIGGCDRTGMGYPIPREELTGVLVAVYLAEAEAELRGGSPVDARVEALRALGYDTTALNVTLENLARDPEMAKDIYQSVLDSVIHEQRDIRGEFPAETD